MLNQSHSLFILFVESEEFGREYFEVDDDDVMGQLERLSDEAAVQTEIDGFVRRVGLEVG